MPINEGGQIQLNFVTVASTPQNYTAIWKELLRQPSYMDHGARLHQAIGLMKCDGHKALRNTTFSEKQCVDASSRGQGSYILKPHLWTIIRKKGFIDVNGLHTEHAIAYHKSQSGQRCGDPQALTPMTDRYHCLKSVNIPEIRGGQIYLIPATDVPSRWNSTETE